MKKGEAKTLKPGDRVMAGGIGTTNVATVISVHETGKQVLVRYDRPTSTKIGKTDEFLISSARIERFKE